jgi:hypothetical protein
MSSSDLFHIAKSSLEANIVELQSGKYLRAGANHYFLPFKTALYKSEGPFSWSSALLLEALEAPKKSSAD